MSKDNKNKKGKKKFIVLGVILAIIIFLVVSVVRCGQKAAEAFISEDTVAVRDIKNYHSYTGTISAKDEQIVLPEQAAKVVTVNVKKGDEVKKGDIIAVLDSTAIEESIEDLEASMSINAISNALTLNEANITYNNYLSNIENNYNSQLNGASQQVESSLESWVIAKKNYENEVNLNSKGYSSTLISSTSNIDSAYNNLLSAQASYDRTFSNEYATEYDKTQAMTSRENAEISYEMSIKSYEAAKINEDITLTRLYDTLIQAQNNYYNAVKNYDTTKVQVLQQLDSYKMNVKKAELGTNQTLNELKLARLYSDLDKYVIKAPRDGVITSLDIKEGDFTTTGKSVAAITDYDVLQVDIKINEYDMGTIGLGSEVEIYVNALAKTCVGKLTYIDRNATVDNGVSYFKSEVNFDGEDDIRCGMSVEVRAYVDNKENILTLNADAINVREDGTTFVNLKNEDGSQTEQDVVTGISDGTFIEIIEGLDEGQKVIYVPSTYDIFNSYMEEAEASDRR